MKRGIIFLILFVTSHAHAQPTSKIDSLAMSGVDLVYQMKFDEGIAQFDEIIKQNPHNPLGYFLRASSSYWFILSDMQDSEKVDQFKEECQNAIDVAKEKLKQNQNDLDARFYLGSLYTVLGAYEGLNHHWWSAYWKSKKGKDHLNQVIEKDSTYYDAYLGLGMYHYYAETVPQILKMMSFILGIDANRKKGLEEIQLAADKGKYTKIQALFCLADINLRLEKNYWKAYGLFRALNAQYPHNLIFKIGLGKCYQHTKRHHQALNTFQEVINEDHDQQFPEIVLYAHYLIGRVYYELNQFELAKENFNKIVGDTTDQQNHWAYANACYRLGLTCEILGERDTALTYYQRITENADEELQQAINERLQKPFLPAQIDLIKSDNFYQTGAYRQAMTHYQQILIKTKTNQSGYSSENLMEIYYSIGKIYHIKGNCDSAIVYLEKALQCRQIIHDWIQPYAHYRLAKCYQQAGHIEKANQHFDQAYQFKNPIICRKIDRIRQK